MSEAVKVAFASGTEELNRKFIARLKEIYPELPLYVVSEFRPQDGERWIPFHPPHGLRENLARCRAALDGRPVRLSAVLLAARRPYRPMKAMALWLAPARFIAFNENLGNFMLRPRCLPVIVRHALWRLKQFVWTTTHPGGGVHRSLWLLARPREWSRPAARMAGAFAGVAVAALRLLLPHRPAPGVSGAAPLPPGISVVIPSRNGRRLLERLLPSLVAESPDEVIVVDNGSDDGTAEYLAGCYPKVRVEVSAMPLSFSAAANRGIRAARFSHLLLLNNDMRVERGALAALRRSFECVPDLFAATAEILFPPGIRREETGKAVMPPPTLRNRADFPLRCDLPLPGEDLSYVLYGSGGCSLYSTAKLRALGGLDEIYRPAYVEDLDLGYRAWRLGWPTVFCAGARVLHEHRATTSRYFSPQELETCLETNYLRFVARAVASPRLFRSLWRGALWRLNARAAEYDAAAQAALATAWRAPFWFRRAPTPALADELVLAAGSGQAAVFPGRPASGKSVVLIATPLAPFPLSHGGAVRMYNLMRLAARDYDQVLVSFTTDLAPPPYQLLDLCAEVVLVARTGTHTRPRTARPDTVEEFDSPAFHAVLRQMMRKWRPAVAQLEFTHMAQYARDCAPARTVLVEHDVTIDLYEQLLRERPDFDLRREYDRWVRFETEAWREVVVMSEQDRARIAGGRAFVLPNGVDLERFRPAAREPAPNRLLFIGAFRHLPNVLAVEFFLREVWLRLERLSPVLHIIAGPEYERYLKLDLAGVEVEGFVADVRPAYERAAVVIAPLVASAGTNIKILEAMAMGKAVVSTPAGVNGLALAHGTDLLVASTPAELAAAIEELLTDPDRRRALELQARATAERAHGWESAAARQAELYESLRLGGQRI